MKKEYSIEELKSVIKECDTIRQVLIKFNRNESSASYRVLNKKIKEWSIDTTHFLTQSEIFKRTFANGKLKILTNEEIFIKDSTTGRSTVKKRITSEELIEYKCISCGNDGTWMDKKITLILDHINGINNDNRLENLRFMCPNCNSTLATHCLGSKGLIEKPEKVDGRKNRPKHDRVETRKVVWPSSDELEEMIKTMSYCAIGRKYGVSDNAIRKWAKSYEII